MVVFNIMSTIPVQRLPDYAEASHFRKAVVKNELKLNTLLETCAAVINNRTDHSSQPVYLFTREGKPFGVVITRSKNNVHIQFVNDTGNPISNIGRNLGPQEMQSIANKHIDTLKRIVCDLITSSEHTLFPPSNTMATNGNGDRTSATNNLHRPQAGIEVTAEDRQIKKHYRPGDEDSDTSSTGLNGDSDTSSTNPNIEDFQIESEPPTLHPVEPTDDDEARKDRHQVT